MRKKKKQRQVYRRGGGARAVGALVVGSTGASLIGSAMPGTSGAALKSAGGSMASFVSPAVTVLGAGMVVKQLRKLPKPKKKRRNRR